MPTGYTNLIEKGITFNRFVLQCARAFGACVTQRDEDMGQLPRLQKLDAKYHKDSIEKAKEKLKMAKLCTDLQIQALIDNDKQKLIKYNSKSKLEKENLLAKYNDMLDKVKNWTPPTPNHDRLKEFMIEQIESSIKFDCGTSYESPIMNYTVKEYRKMLIDNENDDIKYHTKQIREETKRINEANKWITDLYNNLKTK